MNFKHSTLGFDKIYVINLKRRKDRKEDIIKAFPGVNLTFIEAVDGNNLNQDQLIKEGKLNTSFYDPTGMVTMGIFACALSHKKAWDQALADGVKNALFLEDDVYSIIPLIEGNNFSPQYQSILNDIKQFDWDLIHLGKKTADQMGINIGNNLVTPRYKSSYNGAHAYAANKNMIKTLSEQYLPIQFAADVYLEEFYNSKFNIFTLRESLIRQVSDTTLAQEADSDTYYNEYREGGGRIGISFDEEGNVINKKIVKYIKHPKDMLVNYTECVLEKPKFGLQKFNNLSLFGLTDMLKHLSNFLDKDSQMVELYSHLGESTFFFGCSNLFKNVYCIDPLKGEDEFNIKNNLVWEDIRSGFHSNTYHFENINHIEKDPKKTVGSFKDISFLYINNRNNIDVKNLINLYLPIIKKEGFIGGSGNINFTPTKTFRDGSWILKKEDAAKI